MRIGELAQHTGLSRETLRFYESLGLIQARRSQNGYRDYDSAVVLLVHYIRRAQSLGFSLQEIGLRLPEIWQSPQPEAMLVEVLTHKLDEIEQRILALSELKQQLSQQLQAVCPLRKQALAAA